MRKQLITEHLKMSHTGQIPITNEMHEGMEVQLYAFLISALYEMRWQIHATDISCLGRGVTTDTIQCQELYKLHFQNYYKRYSVQLVFVSNNAGS
jgi:hypothetical protein